MQQRTFVGHDVKFLAVAVEAVNFSLLRPLTAWLSLRFVFIVNVLILRRRSIVIQIGINLWSYAAVFRIGLNHFEENFLRKC